MFDRTVPHIPIAMVCEHLGCLPDFPVPEGYSLRAYRPGDAARWAEIETSCGEFNSIDSARKGFIRSFGEDDAPLAERMAFAVAPDGAVCATIACWYDSERPDTARLHWLGVREDHQGKKLSKAMVSWAMRKAKEMGYARMVLTTQTESWVAIKVYLQAGFAFAPRTPRDEEAWAIVRGKIGEP